MTLQIYVNADLDKTEKLMNLKNQNALNGNRILSIVFHLKTHSILKSKFRKIQVENTTIIAHKINNLRLQILEALHIKT